MAIVRAFIAFLATRRNRFVRCPVGHIAENCASEQRLCYNCRQPGHESAACPQPRSVAAKQCYSCGGVGHIQAECPSLKQNSGQKCYVSTPIMSNLLPSNSYRPAQPELWPVRTFCALLPQRHWRFRVSCSCRWTRLEHLYASADQVLQVRRP